MTALAAEAAAAGPPIVWGDAPQGAIVLDKDGDLAVVCADRQSYWLRIGGEWKSRDVGTHPHGHWTGRVRVLARTPDGSTPTREQARALAEAALAAVLGRVASAAAGPIAALGAPPAEADLRGTGGPALLHSGAAYASETGAVLLIWGRGSRYSYSSADRQDWGAAQHGLLALGLSDEDCERICGRWRGLDVAVNRADRRLAVRAAAPGWARDRARLLRALRTAEQPPGSLCLARFYGGARPLLRFPDGRGWWCCRDRLQPWAWSRAQAGAALRVLALDLTEEQCLALAGCASTEDCEGVLRLRGLG